MLYILIAAFASFLLGVAFSVYIVMKFRKLPEAPVGQNYRLTSAGWESVGEDATPGVDQTRPVEAVELDQLVAAGRKPKGLAAFEEKTRQVQEFEFADLLQVDHEEMVAEPVASDNEEQLAIAREDSRLLKIAIEKSGPVGVSEVRPAGRDVLPPLAMLQAPQPPHFIFSSRSGNGLMN